MASAPCCREFDDMSPLYRCKRTRAMSPMTISGRSYIDVLSRCLPEIPPSDSGDADVVTVGASYVVLGQSEPVGLRQLASSSPMSVSLSPGALPGNAGVESWRVTAPMTPGLTQTPTKPKVAGSNLAARREVGMPRRG